MATIDADVEPTFAYCYVEGVSWSYYEQLIEELGGRRLRLAFLDGQMEFLCPLVLSQGLKPKEHLALDQVSWSFYERSLEEFRDRHVRIWFLDGSIEIMSPLPRHEFLKKAIANLIFVLALETGVRFRSSGSPTLRIEGEVGLEPDECFYFGQTEALTQVERFDSNMTRPPDLAVEVDIFSSSVPREPIYSRLKVREIWRYDGRKLKVRLLGNDDQYVDSANSLAFPTLPMDVLQSFIERCLAEDEGTVMRDFQTWVRSRSPA